MAKSKKLEMVKAEPGSVAIGGAASLFQKVEPGLLPANAKKLTKPPMLKLDTIPVGAMVKGEVVGICDSLSPREDMRGAKLIHMKHENGAEFLLPLSGVIKKAIGGVDGVNENAGKTLIVVRQPDGETTKYAAKGEGPKKVFMFDVFIVD